MIDDYEDPWLPPGVDEFNPVPDPAEAAARIIEYVCWFGDGLIDGDPDGFPLHSRDLDAVAVALQKMVERAERSEATLKRVREALAGHPACDNYPDGDPITCGWKRAVADVHTALEGNPE